MYTRQKTSGASLLFMFRMVLNLNQPTCRLCIIILLAAFIKHAHGQSSNATDEYFDPLKDLERTVPYHIGSQNFTRCCLRALEVWKNTQNPEIIVQSSKNPLNIFKSAHDFSSSKEQFPCGAGYRDDGDGAPEVKISYRWCKSNCGGWQRSRSAALEQWVQPFVGFILPAAVFCLNV